MLMCPRYASSRPCYHSERLSLPCSTNKRMVSIIPNAGWSGRLVAPWQDGSASVQTRGRPTISRPADSSISLVGGTSWSRLCLTYTTCSSTRSRQKPGPLTSFFDQFFSRFGMGRPEQLTPSLGGSKDQPGQPIKRTRHSRVKTGCKTCKYVD